MISMSCSKVHLRLVKKFPGPCGGVGGFVGGCGRGGAGGGDETAACSLGGDASCDVLVHALAAASDSSRPAAIALRLLGPLNMDVIMQRLLADQLLGCAKMH